MLSVPGDLGIVLRIIIFTFASNDYQPSPFFIPGGHFNQKKQ